jgi:hypothetical protein
MSAQKRGGDGDWTASSQGSRRPQLPLLGFQVQSVARLDFNGGDAFGDQGV